MTNNNNNLIIENKKLFETVYELKSENEIPSFEEFMETYENDGNLSYEDLIGGDMGEARGYGPCTDGRNFRDCYCSREELGNQRTTNITNITIQNNIYNIGINRGPGTTPRLITPSIRFRFGYSATNYYFGKPVCYKNIYESANELRNDASNISSKSGYWATMWAGPLCNGRITDYQASEGYRYAKGALERYDEGHSVNLKCWSICHSFGGEESESQNMGDNGNGSF